MRKQQFMLYTLIAVFSACLLPETAMAYAGPGAGLSAIGAFLAICAAIIAAIFGFIWYPIKRLIRKFRDKGKASQGPPT